MLGLALVEEDLDGMNVGRSVRDGDPLGTELGWEVGCDDGRPAGPSEGWLLGCADGVSDGCDEGWPDGSFEGWLLGSHEQ